MISTILILFNTKKALQKLNDEYELALLRKALILVGLHALALFFLQTVIGEQLPLYLNSILFIFFLALLFDVGLAWLNSFILFKIGNRLEGKATLIDLFSLVAHSHIPRILTLLLLPLVQLFYGSDYEISNTICISVCIVFELLSLKIIFEGVRFFNDFSAKKTLITLIPILLFTAISLGVSLYLVGV